MTNSINRIKLILKITLFIMLLAFQGCVKEYCCYREAELGYCSDGLWPTSDDCWEHGETWTDEINGIDQCFSDEQACRDACKSVTCEETLQ